MKNPKGSLPAPGHPHRAHRSKKNRHYNKEHILVIEKKKKLERIKINELLEERPTP